METNELPVALVLVGTFGEVLFFDQVCSQHNRPLLDDREGKLSIEPYIPAARVKEAIDAEYKKAQASTTREDLQLASYAAKVMEELIADVKA